MKNIFLNKTMPTGVYMTLYRNLLVVLLFIYYIQKRTINITFVIPNTLK